jgi:hypothetical protein
VDLHCCVEPEGYKCPVEVEAELLDCGHKVKKPCHMDIELFSCSYPCEDHLPCGHRCVRRCHKSNDPDHLQVSIDIYRFISECCFVFLHTYLCLHTWTYACPHTHIQYCITLSCVFQPYRAIIRLICCHMLVIRHAVWTGNWIYWTLLTRNNR